MNKLWQMIFLNLTWTIAATSAIYYFGDLGYFGEGFKNELLLIGGFPLEFGSIFFAIFTLGGLLTIWLLYRHHSNSSK